MVVMTMDDDVVEAEAPERPCTLLLPTGTRGMMDAAKKSEGYMSVIVPPIGIGVAGEKDRVNCTFVLPLIRCDEGMPKTTPETCPLIAPDEVATDGRTSEDVCTVTTPPRVTAPITNPDMVTRKALEFMLAPAVVMTTEEAVGGAHVAANDAMLLLPATIVGVAD
jgi:hypothetical protein